MKHLKTYEVTVGTLTIEFKKYIVIETKKSIDLYKINNEEYKCSLLAFYSKETKIMRQNIYNRSFFKITNVFNFNDNIVFQTDSEKDALEYMKIINDLNKYNI